MRNFKSYKMRVKILIIFSLVTAIQSFGQVIDNPMTIASEKSEKKRITAKVSKLTMMIYEAKKNGKLPKEGKLRSVVNYNSDGKVTLSKSIFPDMTVQSKYEYDENGNTIKMTSLNGVGQIRQKLVYEYDDDNNLLRTKYYKPNGELRSTKENKEELIEGIKISRNTSGEITSKSISFYDSTNNIYTTQLLTPTDELRYENLYRLNDDFSIKEWKVTDNVQGKKYIQSYEYDNNGNEISETRTNFDKTLIRKFEKKYNEKGLIVESIWTDSSGKIKQVSKYTYEYF